MSKESRYLKLQKRIMQFTKLRHAGTALQTIYLRRDLASFFYAKCRAKQMGITFTQKHILQIKRTAALVSIYSMAQSIYGKSIFTKDLKTPCCNLIVMNTSVYIGNAKGVTTYIEKLFVMRCILQRVKEFVSATRRCLRTDQRRQRIYDAITQLLQSQRSCVFC